MLSLRDFMKGYAVGNDGIPVTYVDHHGMRRQRLQNEEYSIYRSNANEHLGDDEDEVHDHLAASHKFDGKDLGEIKKYTSGSTNLNRGLFRHFIEGKNAPSKIEGDDGTKHDIKALDKAVTKHKLSHELHVFSGIHFHPGELAKEHPEGHVHLAGYTSTTIHKQVASDFAQATAERKPHILRHDDDIEGHIMHVKLPKGFAGAYVAHHSEHPYEHEYVLPRNTKLKFSGKSTVHVDSVGRHFKVWHAEPV